MLKLRMSKKEREKTLSATKNQVWKYSPLPQFPCKLVIRNICIHNHAIANHQCER